MSYRRATRLLEKSRHKIVAEAPLSRCAPHCCCMCVLHLKLTFPPIYYLRGKSSRQFIAQQGSPSCIVVLYRYGTTAAPTSNSDPGSLSEQALLPPPHYGTRLPFHRENTGSPFFLSSSIRITSCVYPRCLALSAVEPFSSFFFRKNTKKSDLVRELRFP